MPRALHLINHADPKRGGAQRILAVICDGESEVVTKTTYLRGTPMWLPSVFRLMIFLGHLLYARRPAVAIIHSRMFLPLVWIFRLFGLKTVFYAHAHYRSHGWITKVFRSHAYIAVSEAVFQYLVSLGIERSDVTVVFNPYLEEPYKEPQSVPGSSFGLGFVGGLHAWKGIAELIEALRRVKEVGLEINLRVIGDGPLRSQVEMMASQSSNGFRIQVLGYCPSPFSQLRDIPCIVIPSLEEGFGLVAVEAIAQGKIVVYSDIPALREVCEGDEYCIPFNVADPISLKSGLLDARAKFFADPMGSQSGARRRAVTSRYDKARFLANYRATLRKICEGQ